MRNVLIGVVLGSLLAVGVAAQGSLSAQVLRLLSQANTWTATQTFTNIIVSGTITTISGATPTITSTSGASCGSSPSIDTGSTNTAGAFTTGTGGANTSCTLTFSVAAPHFWVCHATQEIVSATEAWYIRKTATTGDFSVIPGQATYIYTCEPY